MAEGQNTPPFQPPPINPRTTPSTDELAEVGVRKRAVPNFVDPTFLSGGADKFRRVKNGEYPLFQPNDERNEYTHLPLNVPIGMVRLAKKIKGQFFWARDQDGRPNRGYEPKDFTTNDIQELFGRGTYKVSLYSAEAEPREIWKRVLTIEEGDELPFHCEKGLLKADGTVVPVETKADSDKGDKTDGSGGRMSLMDMLRARQGNSESADDNAADKIFAGNEDHGPIMRRTRDMSRRDDDGPSHGWPQQRSIQQVPPWQQQMTQPTMPQWQPGQPWPWPVPPVQPPAQKEESKVDAKIEELTGALLSIQEENAKKLEETNRRLEETLKAATAKPPVDMVAAITAIGGIASPIIALMMQKNDAEAAARREESARREREEADRRSREEAMRLELLKIERQREEDRIRERDAERRREEEREERREKERADERRREAEKEETRRAEALRAFEERMKYEREQERRREEEARKWLEMQEERRAERRKEEEERKAELEREREERKEAERLREEKMDEKRREIERERIRLDQANLAAASGAGKLNPQLAELLKKIDEQRVSAANNPTSVAKEALKQLGEMRDLLTSAGLVQGPEEPSGGFEKFVSNVLGSMAEKNPELIGTLLTKVASAVMGGPAPAPEPPPTELNLAQGHVVPAQQMISQPQPMAYQPPPEPHQQEYQPIYPDPEPQAPAEPPSTAMALTSNPSQPEDQNP